MDLYNREIISYSAGPNKFTHLVYIAFSNIKRDLALIGTLHTDRGKKFINEQIETLLLIFNIKRSLSLKGNPNDNAVAEANSKGLKLEIIYQN